MTNQKIAIKKVLSAVIGDKRSAKYLDKTDPGLTDGNSIYQAALTYLLSGKTEKAILHIVYGLDIDRNNMQLLHLSKTMLLSISEYLYENNTEVYRLKYPDLHKAEQDLIKRERECNNLLETANSDLSLYTKDLETSKPTFLTFKNLFIIYFFKSKRLKKSIETLEEDISNYNDELSEIKKTLKHISPLVKVDEFSKILGLIIEICTFPTRYEWVLTKK